MNATELFHADGRSAGVWFCGKCRRVYAEGFLDLAAQCCEPKSCSRCKEPYDREWVYTVCRECLTIVQSEQTQKKWDAAVKVDGADFGGGVYDEDGEAFHHDLGEFLESLYERAAEDEAQPVRLPRVFATKKMEFRIEADRLISDLLEHHHEDAYEQIDAAELRQLQELLDAWCSANDPESVEPDYSRAIVYEHLLDWPKEDA